MSWAVGLAALLAVVTILSWRRPLTPHPDLLVCVIDRAAAGERTVWSKAQVAKLVESLDHAGARAVALALPATELEPLAAEGDHAWEQEALAAALATHGRSVLAYPATALPSSSSSGRSPRPRVTGAADGLDLFELTRLETAHDELSEVVWGEGFVAPASGATPLLAREAGRVVPSFALAALAAFEQKSIELASGGREVRVGATTLGLDRHGKRRIPGIRLAAGSSWVAASEVLAGRSDAVMGRLVLVGFSGPEVAMSSRAQAAARSFSLDREAAVFSWLLGGWRNTRRRLGIHLAALFALVTAPFVVGFLTLGHGGRKRRQLEDLRKTFEGNLPPNVLAAWCERPEEAPTTLSRRQATSLSGEITGLMELTEVLAPDRLGGSLSRCLGVLRERIFSQGGAVEHLDALGLRGVFGAPVAAEDHVQRACQAALELRHALLAERGVLAAHHELPLARVPLALEQGLATGVVVSGVLPPPSPGCYSALGAPVVAAARLARLCRTFGVSILVSEAVAAAAGDDFLVRELDRVRLRGHATPLTLFELVSANPAAPADRQRVVRYEAGLVAYRQREFVRAERLFASIVEDLGEDGAARVMAERCRRFRVSAPPEGWDGTASIANA